MQFILNGKNNYLAEECRKREMDYAAVYQRVKNGWSVEKALNTPLRKYKSYEYQGKYYTLKDLCAIRNWNYGFISNRIYQTKLTFEEAVLAWEEKSVKKDKTKQKEVLVSELKIRKPKTTVLKKKDPKSKILKAVLKARLEALHESKNSLNREFYYLTNGFLFFEKKQRKLVKEVHERLKKENATKRNEIYQKLKEL